MDLAGLKRDLDGIKIEDHPAIVQQKSRDFYWYSPVLKRQLDQPITGEYPPEIVDRYPELEGVVRTSGLPYGRPSGSRG